MSNPTKPVAQVSKLLRARDVKAVATDQWQAPDLSALKAKEAEESFQRLLAQVRTEAAEALQMLREADRQAAFEEGRQQGLTQGYDEGYALGLKEAQAVVDQAFDAKLAEWSAEKSALSTQWQSLFYQMSHGFDVLDDAFFAQIIWLSGELAKRMLRAELTLHPEHIQRVVGDALADIPKLVYPVSIFVHPQDIALLHGLSFEQDKKVHILADDSLQRGECRVVSGHSELLHDWQLLSEQVMDKMVTHFVSLAHPTSVAGVPVIDLSEVVTEAPEVVTEAPEVVTEAPVVTEVEIASAPNTEKANHVS